MLIRGCERTFELRERLRAVGMKWLPFAHAWQGVIAVEVLAQMEAEGLRPVAIVPEGHPLDRFAERESSAPSPKTPARKPRSRSRKEAPVGVSAEARAEAFLPEHGWTLQDITANMADDDRAEDERRVERHLRDLRARVKAVRALISADPTIQETLATRREKARAFYAIHGVTAAQVRHGVPEVDVCGLEWEELVEGLRGQFPGAPANGDWVDEEAQRAAAVLPGSGMEVAAIP